MPSEWEVIRRDTNVSFYTIFFVTKYSFISVTYFQTISIDIVHFKSHVSPILCIPY